MNQHDPETDTRIYAGLSAAIKSLAPVDKFDRALGSKAAVAAGLMVYRNNVRAAYLRVLSETFPVVQKLVGEEFFRYMAHEYFHAHPPSSRLVIQYGEALPEFIERFEPVSRLPYLADVARLELAWLSAYHAAEADAVTEANVFALIESVPDSVKFSVHPSARLLSSQYPFHTIWRHNRESADERLRLPDAGETVLIVRPDHRVLTSAISPGVHAFMSSITNGASLHEGLEAAVETEPAASSADIIRKFATSRVITGVIA